LGVLAGVDPVSSDPLRDVVPQTAPAEKNGDGLRPPRSLVGIPGRSAGGGSSRGCRLFMVIERGRREDMTERSLGREGRAPVAHLAVAKFDHSPFPRSRLREVHHHERGANRRHRLGVRLDINASRRHKLRRVEVG